MIRNKVHNILQNYINKEYGIEEPKEITIATVIETLDKLLL